MDRERRCEVCANDGRITVGPNPCNRCIRQPGCVPREDRFIPKPQPVPEEDTVEGRARKAFGSSVSGVSLTTTPETISAHVHRERARALREQTKRVDYRLRGVEYDETFDMVYISALKHAADDEDRLAEGVKP